MECSVIQSRISKENDDMVGLDIMMIYQKFNLYLIIALLVNTFLTDMLHF